MHEDNDSDEDVDEEVFGLDLSDEDDSDAAVNDPEFQELLRKAPGLRKQMGAYEEDERADEDTEEGKTFKN